MSPEKIDKLKKILKEKHPINVESVSNNLNDMNSSLREILQEKIFLEHFSLAAEEKSNYEMSEIFSIVSHEIKTPLVPAIAYLDLVLSESFGPLSDLQKQKLSMVRKSVSDSLRIVDMFMLLKKFEKGEISESRELSDIIAIINNVASEIGNKISIDAPKKMEYEITKRMFEFAIRSILQFCSDLSDDTKIRIKNEDSVTISSDIILTEGQMLNLFEKGYQIDRSSTRETSGTGIELFLAKQILNYNGFSISVSMNNGRLEFFLVPNLHTIF